MSVLAFKYSDPLTEEHFYLSLNYHVVVDNLSYKSSNLIYIHIYILNLTMYVCMYIYMYVSSYLSIYQYDFRNVKMLLMERFVF